jgi:uncharacterized protein (DUF2267 family)
LHHVDPMITSTTSFVDHVAAHAGISAPHAGIVAGQVLSVLSAHLSRPVRELLREELPAELARGLRDDDDHDSSTLPLEERVLEAEMTAGHARELVASVCHVLADELSSVALDAVRREVPAEVATLLEPSAAEPTQVATEPRKNATLASGRPGSEHPLSEARPPRR